MLWRITEGVALAAILVITYKTRSDTMSKISELTAKAEKAFGEISTLVGDLRTEVSALKDRLPDPAEVAALEGVLDKLDDVVPDSVQELPDAGTDTGTDTGTETPATDTNAVTDPATGETVTPDAGDGVDPNATTNDPDFPDAEVQRPAE